LENQLSLLGSNSGGGSGADLNQLANMLRNYAKKSDLDELFKRLDKCEKKTKKAKENSKKCLKEIVEWEP